MGKNPIMDELDERIIEEIDAGEIRYTALARRLHMPISTVHNRIKKMEKDKIIEGYKGQINWKKAGLGLSAYILINIDVGLLKKIGKTQDTLLKELLGIAYVKEGCIITGEADLIVKIVSKDSMQLKDIILDDIGSIQGIIKTKTMIVLG